MTAEAAGGWDQLCTRRNVTFNTMVEALGELLAAGDDDWVPDEAVARARDRKSVV